MGSGDSKSYGAEADLRGNTGIVPSGEQTIIAIKRVSPDKLSAARFQTIVDAVNTALPEFCATWGFPKVTVVVGSGWVRGCFGTITLTDAIKFDINKSSLGYHTLDNFNRPISIVDYNAHEQDNRQLLGYTGDFTGINPNVGNSPNVPHAYLSSTFSHEVFEMLVDPDLNNSLISPGQPIVFRSKVNGDLYPIAREVCDPVSSADFVVENSDGTMVSISNYVFPAWFYKDSPGPYDAARLVKSPLTVLKQGVDYVSTTKCKVVYNTLKGWVSTEESIASH